MPHRLFAILVLLACATRLQAADAPAPAPAGLPADIKWETNSADPPIGDPAALKGGTFNTDLPDYPLTFRIMGPNASDLFANWNHAFTTGFSLVNRHPVTDRYIPWMATHWAVMSDNKTVYFKLDPAARWSDGVPVTADDYVFCWQMIGSKEIVDPTMNSLAADYFQRVEALDPYTLKIVGKRPSWRPLNDWGGLWPMPRHAIKLGPNWVKETTNTPQVAAGPYVVTRAETGRQVVFEKVKNWWGENKGYFKGMYNVDRIVIRIIPEERVLDYFKDGQIDADFVLISRIWAENTDLPALHNGWMHKKRVFVDNPAPLYGLAMNLEVPIFQNKDFRQALQYLFNFDEINNNLMYGAYYRLVSPFDGTEYANASLVPYGFDPRKAREHLDKAGYSKRGNDGIRVNAEGEPARFTLIYGNKGLEAHLTTWQRRLNRAGIDMQLKLLEGATAFNRLLERKYEMSIASYGAGFYPDPYPFFDSIFLKTTNNNNIWAFGRPDTDKLIDIYRFDMNKQARLDAMWKLDAIVQDEAFLIPFWHAPYERILYWDKLCWPKEFLPKRTLIPSIDWQVFWVDPAKEKALHDAMAAGKHLTPDPVVDVDAYGVKAALDAKAKAAKGGK